MRTADKGTLGDCRGESLNGESLDVVPEGGRVGEVGLPHVAPGRQGLCRGLRAKLCTFRRTICLLAPRVSRHTLTEPYMEDNEKRSLLWMPAGLECVPCPIDTYEIW